MLKVENLRKVFRTEESETIALNGVAFDVDEGEFVAVMGPSGCGKSTFCLNLLPPSLRPFYTDSIDFGNKKEAELALHRYALINIDEFDFVFFSHSVWRMSHFLF